MNPFRGVMGRALLSGLVLMVMASPAGILASQRLPVFVSIAPQKYFVERVGAGLVHVSVMVRPGESPATYAPSARQMQALAHARAFFAIGVPFERAWLPRIKAVNPGLVVIDTARGVPLRTLQMPEGAAPGRTVREAAKDPHIWLSPPLVKIQARNIAQGLMALDPAHAEQYRANLRRFLAELDALDAEIRAMLEQADRRRFMVFHPSWGYFADTYGLRQIPVEIEGKEPGPRQLARLVEIARTDAIRVIFVQTQFSTRTAEILARNAGARVVAVDPLSEDYADNLRGVARTFLRALKAP